MLYSFHMKFKKHIIFQKKYMVLQLVWHCNFMSGYHLRPWWCSSHDLPKYDYARTSCTVLQPKSIELYFYTLQLKPRVPAYMLLHNGIKAGLHPKSSIILSLTLCSPLKASRRFGRKWSLHIQSLRIGQSRKLLAMLYSGFLLKPVRRP